MMIETNGENTNIPSELEGKIIQQVEYYFGDINISRDKFLQSEIRKNDGWVSLEVLTTFNRLKNLSVDFSVIINALKKSDSQLLEFHEDNTKIRRSLLKPVPEYSKERITDLKSRSVFAKGFPMDLNLDTLQDFFKSFGKVDYIQMRKNPEKKFKGSVFVIFSKCEDAENFIKKEDVVYNDTPLLLMYRDDYFKKKNEERRKRKEEAKKKDLECKKNDESKAWLEKVVKGAILHMSGFKEDSTREDIREVFDDYAPIAWVDFSKGDEEAWVRFDGEGLATVALNAAREANEGKIEIRGIEISCDVLEGDAELDHWQLIFEKQAEYKNKRKLSKMRKRPGGKDRGGSRNKKFRFDKEQVKDECNPDDNVKNEKGKVEVEIKNEDDNTSVKSETKIENIE